jgi:Tfp pilus assembly protein PilO
MKASDRTILLIFPIALLVVAFYLLLLAPKRNQAAELGDEVSSLQSQIDDQNQVAEFAQQARAQFPRYYGRMVVLGKAVPEQADSASMLVQLDSIARGADVRFRGIELGQASGSSSATATTTSTTTTSTTTTDSSSTGSSSTGGTDTTSTTPGTTTTDSSTTSGQSDTSTSTAATPTPATEAAAASLPIGASVGPAGLPTLPYDLTFDGGFFQIADFIGGVDGLIHLRKGGAQVAVDGRLLTIDGFTLKGGEPGSDPTLQAKFVVTSYLTPAGQGLTLGATPSGPGAPLAPQTTQTSATVAK